MRFKKQIVIICLFTFLFLPMSGKYEEPRAEVITLTTGVIIACAALATACGVVITNQDMLEDVGTRIYDGIKNIDGAIEQVEDKIKINLIPGVISSVVDICLSLPTFDYLTVKPTIENKNSYGWDSGIVDVSSIGSERVFTVSLSPSIDGAIDYTAKSYLKILGGDDTNVSSYANLQGGIMTEGYLKRDFKLKVFKDGFDYYYTSFLNGVEKYTYKLNYKYLYLDVGNYKYLCGVSAEYDKSICIPYTPKNSENVSADKPKEYFPAGSGSISAPLDKPLSDYNPSVDKPISKPNDLVADGDIVADKEEDVVVPDNPALDKPNTDVGDTPATGESLWDTLLGWLKTLFAPLIALLGWIGDILSSILDFLKGLLKSLLEALKSLLEYLFVPTLDIASLILIPDDSGLGQLIQLFDWGELLDITPRPYVFEANMNINSLVDNETTVWNLRFDLFGNETIEKYMPYVRNILSYTCLIGVMYFVIIHFLPNRDID